MSDELTRVAHKAARGSVFLFVGQSVSTVILAVGDIVTARLLGPSNYGLYTLATVVPTMLISLSDAGINSALIHSASSVCAFGAKADRFRGV